MLQSLFQLVFPPQCLGCGEPVDRDRALCGDCWRDAPFVAGTVCDLCGAPIGGPDDGCRAVCDECLARTPPWDQGRAAMLYAGTARRLVLALKHGDRLDLVDPAAAWMVAAGQRFLHADALVVPVPAHWTRNVRRRYNQAALLARAVARQSGAIYFPELLVRARATRPHEGMSAEDRRRNVAGAILAQARHLARAEGREIVLIDDVMTSGATLSEATAACRNAGAGRVCTLVLARVAKAP